MRIITGVRDMQAEADRIRSRGERIGCVPTMGFFHDGHLSLIRKADEISDVVVVSHFINPIQFGAGEDFQKYPRDTDRDKELAEENGCHILFMPSVQEMYPPGFVIYVDVERLTDNLCGASRPGHFRGVTTVVTKLFNIMKPHVAIFGQKDAQQAIIIRRMTEDLNIDTDIVIAPTVREPDGLAMSSRNAYLTETERREAPVLYRSLQKARDLVAAGQRGTTDIIETMTAMIDEMSTAHIDYINIVDMATLEPMERIEQSGLIAVAVWFGKARLIDNTIVNSAPIGR